MKNRDGSQLHRRKWEFYTGMENTSLKCTILNKALLVLITIGSILILGCGSNRGPVITPQECQTAWGCVKGPMANGSGCKHPDWFTDNQSNGMWHVTNSSHHKDVKVWLDHVENHVNNSENIETNETTVTRIIGHTTADNDHDIGCRYIAITDDWMEYDENQYTLVKACFVDSNGNATDCMTSDPTPEAENGREQVNVRSQDLDDKQRLYLRNLAQDLISRSEPITAIDFDQVLGVFSVPNRGSVTLENGAFRSIGADSLSAFAFPISPYDMVEIHCPAIIAGLMTRDLTPNAEVIRFYFVDNARTIRLTYWTSGHEVCSETVTSIELRPTQLRIIGSGQFDYSIDISEPVRLHLQRNKAFRAKPEPH